MTDWIWLFQYLFGIFIGYYLMSLFTTRRLSNFVNRPVIGLVRLAFYRQKQVETSGISFEQKTISAPLINEIQVSELGSYIKGIQISPEQLEKWLQNNPNLKVTKRRE
jgi:uncharacterized protein YneF (UPF0154 family)